MTTDEQQKTAPAVAAWLNPDDQPLPTALQAVYNKLSPDVILVCEQARKQMRDAYVRGLLQVRDALAPSGLFRDWCRAAAVNYNTAKSIVARADQQAREAEAEAEADEQSGGDATHNRSSASGRGKNPKEKRDKYEKSTLRRIVLVGEVDEYNKLVLGLAEVGAALRIDDNFTIVEFLVEDWQAANSASTSTPSAEKEVA